MFRPVKNEWMYKISESYKNLQWYHCPEIRLTWGPRLTNHEPLSSAGTKKKKDSMFPALFTIHQNKRKFSERMIEDSQSTRKGDYADGYLRPWICKLILWLEMAFCFRLGSCHWINQWLYHPTLCGDMNDIFAFH